jgi:hypothetical protein
MKRSNHFSVIGAVILIILIILFLAARNLSKPGTVITSAPSTASSTPLLLHLGTRTKIANCVVNGAYPDTTCTPGAVFPNATVQEICTSGYSSSVRDVPVSEKNMVYTEYGIKTHTKGQYEVDHHISLELGGSNDIANLWPEAAEPKPGFHEKDTVENYLHDQVCKGLMPLQEAQQEIATQWVEVYQRIQAAR